MRILLLLGDSGIALGASPETTIDEEIAQIAQRGDIDVRRAYLHAGAGGRIQDPGCQHDDHARRGFNMCNPAARTQLAVMLTNAAAAVDAEGEVLDVLVQSKRNKSAALKLMRRSGWSRTTCGHMAQRPAIWGLNAGMSAGDGKTIGPRIRINQLYGGSTGCNDSRAPAQPRNSSQFTPPSTIPSTSNAI